MMLKIHWMLIKNYSIDLFVCETKWSYSLTPSFMRLRIKNVYPWMAYSIIKVQKRQFQSDRKRGRDLFQWLPRRSYIIHNFCINLSHQQIDEYPQHLTLPRPVSNCPGSFIFILPQNHRISSQYAWPIFRRGLFLFTLYSNNIVLYRTNGQGVWLWWHCQYAVYIKGQSIQTWQYKPIFLANTPKNYVRCKITGTYNKMLINAFQIC